MLILTGIIWKLEKEYQRFKLTCQKINKQFMIFNRAVLCPSIVHCCKAPLTENRMKGRGKKA